MITSTVATIIHALSPLFGDGGVAVAAGAAAAVVGAGVAIAGAGAVAAGAGAVVAGAGAAALVSVAGGGAALSCAMPGAGKPIAPSNASVTRSFFMEGLLTALPRRSHRCEYARPVRDRR